MAAEVRIVRRNRRAVLISIVACCAVAACSSGSSSSDSPVTPSATPSAVVGAAASASASPAIPVTDTAWGKQVRVVCDQVQSGIASTPEGTGGAASTQAYSSAVQKALKNGHAFDAIQFPAPVDPVLVKVKTFTGQALASLNKANHAAAAGNAPAATDLLDSGTDSVSRVAQTWVLAGAHCGGDPAGIKAAQLTIPLKDRPQGLAAAFGSIWVPERTGGRVVRLDPESGKEQATIDVGQGPVRLEKADGVLWVRTGSEFVRIDPTRNAVTARLAKTAVGPQADKSAAVDGALWILDGSTLYRYDPTTVARTATIPLSGSFDFPTATDDLVVASTYTATPSSATFIDPHTNRVIANVKLPYAAGYPVILKNAVFFPGTAGTNAMVVDRSTWKVTATPKQTAPAGIGQNASDGKTIYVAAALGQSLMTFSAGNYTPGAPLLPVQSFSVVVADNRLWVSGGAVLDFVQRFALAR